MPVPSLHVPPLSGPATPSPCTSRREALAAERAAHAVRARSIVVRRHEQQGPPGSRPQNTHPAPSRFLGPRVRLSVFGSVAAALLFISNATPALAADLAGNATTLTAHSSMTGQTYTVQGTAIVGASRDAYTVTVPVPVIARYTSPDPSTAGSGATASVNTATGSIRWPFPTMVPLSSTFGYRAAPCASCSSYHEGIDMLGGYGNRIGAIAAGTVRISGIDPNYGQYVVIDHIINGQHLSSLYAHMIYGSSPLHVGEHVPVGAMVGLLGSTGDSTGPHLHLSILINGTTFIDPLAWLQKNASPLS